MYLKKNVYDGCRNSQKDSDREGELMMEGILVCDDDQEIVQAIEIYLSQEGYEVYQAHDGLEALKVLQEKKVQLIIMDIMMPRLDGIRATLKIREQNAVPIIILSAKSEDADKILGLNIGADDYLTKPFNPLELVARVKSQLRRYTRLGASPETFLKFTCVSVCVCVCVCACTYT